MNNRGSQRISKQFTSGLYKSTIYYPPETNALTEQLLQNRKFLRKRYKINSSQDLTSKRLPIFQLAVLPKQDYQGKPSQFKQQVKRDSITINPALKIPESNDDDLIELIRSETSAKLRQKINTVPHPLTIPLNIVEQQRFGEYLGYSRKSIQHNKTLISSMGSSELIQQVQKLAPTVQLTQKDLPSTFVNEPYVNRSLQVSRIGKRSSASSQKQTRRQQTLTRPQSAFVKGKRKIVKRAINLEAQCESFENDSRVLRSSLDQSGSLIQMGLMQCNKQAWMIEKSNQRSNYFITQRRIQSKKQMLLDKNSIV